MFASQLKTEAMITRTTKWASAIMAGTTLSVKGIKGGLGLGEPLRPPVFPLKIICLEDEIKFPEIWGKKKAYFEGRIW